MWAVTAVHSVQDWTLQPSLLWLHLKRFAVPRDLWRSDNPAGHVYCVQQRNVGGHETPGTRWTGLEGCCSVSRVAMGSSLPSKTPLDDLQTALQHLSGYCLS